MVVVVVEEEVITKIKMEIVEPDGADCQTERHDGDGQEQHAAPADAVDGCEGNEGGEEVCEGDEQRGEGWGGEGEEVEDCGGVVH